MYNCIFHQNGTQSQRNLFNQSVIYLNKSIRQSKKIQLKLLPSATASSGGTKQLSRDNIDRYDNTTNRDYLYRHTNPNHRDDRNRPPSPQSDYRRGNWNDYNYRGFTHNHDSYHQPQQSPILLDYFERVNNMYSHSSSHNENTSRYVLTFLFVLLMSNYRYSNNY